MDLTLVPYQQQHSSTPKSQSPFFHVKYKECLKNHAASLGGHAHDGCGEFMPPSDHSFTCAACGCHRNFHRRESPSPSQQQQQQHLLLLPPPPPPPPPPHHHQKQLFLYNAGCPPPLNKRPDHEFDDDDDEDDDGGDDHDRRSETPEREDQVSKDFGGASAAAAAAAKSKRFRTKFTAEQKERMLEFAEKIGWRISKHDDVALNQFCCEIGVKRNVLKVWMHNNKNAHHRRGDATPPPYAVSSAAAAPPSVVAPAPQSVGV